MKKLDYKYVNQAFKLAGCKLLENEYINSHAKMHYICNCGNKATICFSNFKNGRRCIKCRAKNSANKLKNSYNYVKSFFNEKGCILLSKSYSNNEEILNYICNCGKEAKISFGNFQAGKRCNTCAINKVSGSNNYNWNPDREEAALRALIRKKCSQLLLNSLKKTKQNKNNSTKEILGYGPIELKEYLYKNWPWTKYDRNWHLDHKFPIKAFLDYNIFDLKLINCLENLQPLEKTKNLTKNAKYEKQAFKDWLNKRGY